MTRLYFDYAATTPVRQEALDAMLPHLASGGYNPSSVHAEGRAAKSALDEARERVAAVLGAKPKEIVFTAGGSEADNLALLGVIHAARRPGAAVVSCVTEHHAVLHALDVLADEGFEVVRCHVGASGTIDRSDFKRALESSPALVSVMYVNNEIGVVQPIAELAHEAHARGALMHTDAVQAAQFLPLDVHSLDVDLLSLASHKVYGPKGVGALYVRDGVPLAPMVYGGSQEFGKRAGTENVAGIVGFATALELAAKERDVAAQRLTRLREAFEARVSSRIPDCRINGAGAPRAPHITNLSFAGLDSEQLLMRLDLDGVAVSAGSACTSGAIEPSHVIGALGLEAEWMRGVLRFSFGRTTIEGEVQRAAEILERAAADLRAVSACF